jgi:very-short-patch-repair endonuclease
MKYVEIKELAQRLRNNPTDAENLLWGKIRKRKLEGFKFLRQHPIIYESRNGESFFFIPDFYCAAKMVVIELDGRIHDYQKNRDYNRDEILRALNLNILRIKNDELKDMEKVMDKIKTFLKNLP